MRRLLSLTGIGIGAGIALAALSVGAQAADIEVPSRIDSVTVYPDGATVTRIVKADLIAGDNTLLARDLPLSLDPSSLRVEGESGANLTIGAIDIRTPRPSPPTNLPEIDQRIEAIDFCQRQFHGNQLYRQGFERGAHRINVFECVLRGKTPTCT